MFVNRDFAIYAGCKRRTRDIHLFFKYIPQCSPGPHTKGYGRNFVKCSLRKKKKKIAIYPKRIAQFLKNYLVRTELANRNNESIRINPNITNNNLLQLVYFQIFFGGGGGLVLSSYQLRGYFGFFLGRGVK